MPSSAIMPEEPRGDQRPARVGIVSDWYPPRLGGLEAHVHDLAVELRARGHEVRVLCSTPAGGTAPDDIPVVRLRIRRDPWWRTGLDPGAAGLAAQWIHDERITVVHGHSFLSGLTLAALAAARRAGVGSVLTEHTVLRGAPLALGRVLHRLTGFGDLPTVVSAVSGFVARELVALTGRPAEVLYNGVAPADWTAREGFSWPPRVLAALRFERRKRPDRVVRVASILARRGRPEVRVMMLGDGPERAKTEALARALGVERQVSFAGHVPRGVVRDELARSHCLLLTSEFESLSGVALQARAAGVPVVSTPSGGVTEAIRPGVDGLIADTDEALADAVLTLIDDEAKNRAMGVAAREGLERFAWDAVIARHLALYRRASSESVPNRAPRASRR